MPDTFLEQLSIALTLLREHPNVGSRRFAHLFPGIDLRTWSLDRFPFRIFYMIEGDTLHVLRVDHERRNVTTKTIGPRGRTKKGGGE
ncbi:ParE toxin of type II toxin-antitoxin system, parDE [Rugamonas rubra]|uniref:ParE toxin of type II toxin-antitoxin system, parDE n=1 Tax=Rugamonas rubra TaxID=758825 RepID=A0A1I4MLV2_9BURK|nr:ParE toxin of type II toxin-antitoxin system, parDE [Rugamonas rubra]